MARGHHQFRLLLIYAALAVPWIIYGAICALETNANSPIEWVTSKFSARADYETFEAGFGPGDVVLLSFRGCTIANSRLDEVVKRLREDAAFFDADRNWLFDRVVCGRETYTRMTGKKDLFQPAEARRRLRGTLIGPDQKTTCVAIGFTPAGLADRVRLVPEVRRVVAETAAVAPDAIHMAGPVIDGYSVDRASKSAMDLLAVPSAALLFVVCWLCLRQFRAAVLVFAVALYAQALTLAIIHYSGEQMNALLIVMPPLVQVLAVAGGIHLVNYYLEAAQTLEGPQAAWAAFSLGWLPCVLSAATTAVGMASLLVSQLTPIRSFGGFAAVGVLATTGLLLVVVPGTLSRWPLGRPAQRTTPSAQQNFGWQQFTHWLSRDFGLIAALAAAVMIGLGAGALSVKSSVRIETLFAPHSRVLEDYAWLEEHVGPTVPIEVLLEFDDQDGWSPRDEFSLVWQVQQQVERIPAVGATLSAASLVPPFPEELRGHDAEVHRIVNQLLDKNLQQFVDMRYVQNPAGRRVYRVSAFVSALDPIDYGQFLTVVRRRVDATLQHANLKAARSVNVTYTGIMPLVHEIQRQLMRDLFISFMGAFVIVAIVMSVVQGGVVPGLIAMIPNVFPALVVFGILGWTHMAVDIGTVMTASVALGIAVDDTMHFLTFFRREVDRGSEPRAAVEAAFRHCGRAMIQTSVICCLGLAVFMLSDFVPIARFSCLLIALILMALLGDLVVLPALLLSPLGRVFVRPPPVSVT